jgi:hypothetical protein
VLRLCGATRQKVTLVVCAVQVFAYYTDTTRNTADKGTVIRFVERYGQLSQRIHPLLSTGPP